MTGYTLENLDQLISTLDSAIAQTRQDEDGVVGQGVCPVSERMEEIARVIGEARRMARHTLVLQGVPVAQLEF